MTRKSGLHKKVSSIFGDMPIPGNPPAGNGKSSPGAPLPGIDNRQAMNRPAPGKPAPVTSLRFTEEQEYAASQRKKLFAIIALACILGVVLFLNFYKPGKTATQNNSTAKKTTAAALNDVEISWPDPGIWPSDIKDPMIMNSMITLDNLKNEGTLTLRGIVGGSMALIGTEILYKGDQYQGWIVKEILKDSVVLEKPDGEKLELKMEDTGNVSVNNK